MIMSYCEDAPCCGCCGTNLYGVSESSYYDEYDAPDYDDEPLDPSECDHTAGNYDDIDPLAGTVTCADCYTDGVSYTIMGEDRYSFPDTKINYEYEGGEDRHLDGSYEM